MTVQRDQLAIPHGNVDGVSSHGRGLAYQMSELAFPQDVSARTLQRKEAMVARTEEHPPVRNGGRRGLGSACVDPPEFLALEPAVDEQTGGMRDITACDRPVVRINGRVDPGRRWQHWPGEEDAGCPQPPDEQGGAGYDGEHETESVDRQHSRVDTPPFGESYWPQVTV